MDEQRMRRLPARREAERMIASSAMHDHYGGMLRVLFERLFGPVHYPADSADRIRAMAACGTVIYVARARSTWLALYFNHALSRLRLPLPRFVGGLSLLLWQPVDRLWKLLRQGRRAIAGPWRERYGDAPPTRAEALLADIALHGEAAFLFLHDRRSLTGAQRPANDYLRALVAAQHTTGNPIYLIPHAVSERSQSGAMRATLRERLFRARRRPGRRPLPIHVRVPPRAVVRVGEAIDLRKLIAEYPDSDDAMLARRLRHELDHRITLEERVVVGPELPTPAAVARRVLRDPRVREAIAEQAEKSGQEAAAAGKRAVSAERRAAAVERRAAAQLREIAARYHTRALVFLSTVVGWIFNRIYDGILLDETGMLRSLEAQRRGQVIFCPAHRSHIDYLALSYLLWTHGLAPPHIAAGANLSFFPLGPIFRGCGAFFLRRSFRGDSLYGAVFRAYLTELVRQGTSMEFFIEGGRSRTGKLLMPRFGLLTMVIDAWRRGVRDDIQLVPVSVDYERIIEAGSYEHELRGGQKRREDIGGLFRSTKVLRSRYGRVHVQFGEPVSLADFAHRLRLEQSAAPEHDEAWRVGVEKLGYRILHDVSRVVTVTPTAVAATALLGHPGRGLAHGALVSRIHEVIDYLDTSAARLSPAIATPETRTQAVLEAVQKLVEEGAVAVDRPGRGDMEPIYRAVEQRRVALDYYKNSIMNYVAPPAIVCRSIRRRGEGRLSYEDLHEDAHFLSRLFKREFLYRADTEFDTLFDEALAALAARGFLDANDDGSVDIREPAPISLLAGLLDSFVEAYWVTTTTTRELRKFPLWRREVASRAMERARRAFLEGHIRRPESAGRTLIENALDWMIATRVLNRQGAEKRQTLQLASDYDGGRLEQLIGEIAAFL